MQIQSVSDLIHNRAPPSATVSTDCRLSRHKMASAIWATGSRCLLNRACCTRTAKINRVYASYRGGKGNGQFDRTASWLTCVGLLTTGVFVTCGTVLYFLDRTVHAVGAAIKLPSYPWKFEGFFRSLDHGAVRRGWEVYRQICRTCHSIRYVRFMDLVNVTHTEEEAKEIAAEFECEDGPNEDGDNYTRPCKLSDRIPMPYANDEIAKMVNRGVIPPDLTYAVLSKRNGYNHMFSVLTGYMDAPAGVTVLSDKYFNIYFEGGIIGMPNMIHDGIVEYDDGTPATSSQIAKDVVEFMTWTSSQDHDTRKAMLVKALGIYAILFYVVWHMLRQRWSIVKTRQISFVPKKPY